MSSLDDAVARGVGLLARREHGYQELRAKLVAKGVAAEVAEQTVKKLAEEGIQSDQRFAEALVRHRIERGYGPAYIRGELRERRVDANLVQAQLQRPDEYWLRLAKKTLARRVAPSERLGSNLNNRHARFLARRGFSSATVLKALRGLSETD